MNDFETVREQLQFDKQQASYDTINKLNIPAYIEAEEALDRIQAEVERLRAERDTANAEVGVLRVKVVEAEGELAVAYGGGTTEPEREWFSALDKAKAEVERLRAVVDYAANMPDDENMPEWAKELRHHARNALAEEEPA